MRKYDYREKWKKLLTPEIISLLTSIHEDKGEQRLIAERYADVLTDLVDIARIQSTDTLLSFFRIGSVPCRIPPVSTARLSGL